MVQKLYYVNEIELRISIEDDDEETVVAYKYIYLCLL